MANFHANDLRKLSDFGGNMGCCWAIGGIDLRLIQKLLGHRSRRTTEIYTHLNKKCVQQIQSAFDDL
jgi:integrase